MQDVLVVWLQKGSDVRARDSQLHLRDRILQNAQR